MQFIQRPRSSQENISCTYFSRKWFPRCFLFPEMSAVSRRERDKTIFIRERKARRFLRRQIGRERDNVVKNRDLGTDLVVVVDLTVSSSLWAVAIAIATIVNTDLYALLQQLYALLLLLLHVLYASVAVVVVVVCCCFSCYSQTCFCYCCFFLLQQLLL